MAKKQTTEGGEAPVSFSYGASLERLRTITELLQAPDTPFEQRVSLFREGQQLLRQCQAYLASVELEFAQAPESYE